MFKVLKQKSVEKSSAKEDNSFVEESESNRTQESVCSSKDEALVKSESTDGRAWKRKLYVLKMMLLLEIYKMVNLILKTNARTRMGIDSPQNQKKGLE